MHYFQQNHAAEVQIVLVGTGLDRIKDQDVEQYNTDPTKVSFVEMMQPDLGGPLEAIISKDLKTVIEQGVFSKILAENARMLFHGVLPVLQSEILNLQPPDYAVDLDTRRRFAASTLHIMDLAFADIC